MVLDVIAGPDSKDSTCIPVGSSSNRGGGGFAAGLLEGSLAADVTGSSWPLKGVTVGIPREFNVEELGETDVGPTLNSRKEKGVHGQLQASRTAELAPCNNPPALRALADG